MVIVGVLPVLVLLGIAIFVLLGILSAVWVFIDARRRRIRPLRWLLLAFLLSVIGLFIYWFFVRRKRRR